MRIRQATGFEGNAGVIVAENNGVAGFFRVPAACYTVVRLKRENVPPACGIQSASEKLPSPWNKAPDIYPSNSYSRTAVGEAAGEPVY